VTCARMSCKCGQRKQCRKCNGGRHVTHEWLSWEAERQASFLRRRTQ
jgi:hypothetical protein